MDNNKRFWERVAKLYTPIQEKSNHRLYAAVIERCGMYITEHKRVLELACGTGQFTLPLYEKARYWEATDFSERMTEETQKRCPFVHVSVQDATHLSHESNSFHVVLIANALHIMPEPDRALSEIKRVLCDDGILLAPTFVYEGRINRFRMWLTTQLGFKTFYKWTLHELSDYLEKAGFQVIETVLIPGSPLPEGFVAAKKQKE